MGRKSKYTPELAQAICQAIATHGGHESGWKAGGISPDTFYQWIQKYPEFSEGIERAVEEFRKNCSEELKNTALQRLEEALKNGQKITWKTTSKRKTERRNAHGELLWEQIEVVESEHIENRPTPQWAIERVIPKPILDMGQLQSIASEYGVELIIKDVDLFADFANQIAGNRQQIERSGLSEEAANQIRARILGINLGGENEQS